MVKITFYPYINKVKKIALLTLIFLFVLSGKSQATHIVGGEFELIHVSGFTYQLNLIIYFDDVNGNPAAEDPSALPFIFRKSDNAFMDSVRLINRGSSFVTYTNPECAIGDLVTRRIVYSNNITLAPDRYNDPEGYYIVWERCCRNNTIDNVVLIADNTVGQTFYLEFPPVVDERENAFINTSPILFPPLSDFACVGQQYFADFAGTDPDGDSIVYSMATPLNSSSIVALPIPTPNNPDLESRPRVPWIEGINVNNMVPGIPSLRISREGLLTVTPTLPGLYVFAVKVDEFRAGVKIGEVRRDFQMLVLDCPPPGVQPGLTVRVPGNEGFNNEVDTLKFAVTDDKCFNLLVTDRDGGETIVMNAIPVNFSENINNIFTNDRGQIINGNDTLNIQVCLPDCPLKENEPFIIDFVATDNTCPLPLMDTLRLVIEVQSPENNDPGLAASDPEFAGFDDLIETTQFAGNLFKITLSGEDVDGDLLTLDMLPVGVNVENFDISFNNISSEPGKIVSVLEWDLNCEDFNFEDTIQDNSFTFQFLLDDINECSSGQPDTLTLNLTVEDVPNTHKVFQPPNVFTPNDDGINDYFELCEGEDCDPRFVLPKDNCTARFIGINVYNRWGRLVFSDTRRNFRWDGENAPPGIYYYYLSFTNGLEYNGTLTILQ